MSDVPLPPRFVLERAPDGQLSVRWLNAPSTVGKLDDGAMREIASALLDMARTIETDDRLSNHDLQDDVVVPSPRVPLLPL